MKTRIISALVGIVLLAVVLSFFQTIVLNVAIMVIILMAMYEFLTATKISHNKLLSAVAFVVAAAFPISGCKGSWICCRCFCCPILRCCF